MINSNSEGTSGGNGDKRTERLKQQQALLARILKGTEELAREKQSEDLDRLIDVGSILQRVAKVETDLFSAHPNPYQVTFPDEFYFHIYRLKGWDTSPENLKNRPGIVGTWTNWIIYMMFPVGTIRMFREKCRANGYGYRQYKFHQFLSFRGRELLLMRIESAIELMCKCGNWDQFKRLLAKGYRKPYQPCMFDTDDLDWRPKV